MILPATWSNCTRKPQHAYQPDCYRATLERFVSLR